MVKTYFLFQTPDYGNVIDNLNDRKIKYLLKGAKYKL